jgi:hypothetical protein
MKSIHTCCFLAVLLLFLNSACLSKWSYEKAREEDTIKAYEAFLEAHKSQKYAKKARERLEELYFAKAQKEATYGAYSAFIEKYPFGKFSKEAERRAEDLRAGEMGIHLYRSLPDDYYQTVTATELPFRIMVKAKVEESRDRALEIKWFEELHRRDLFVPMDPRKVYRVKPDMTLHLRESMVEFYSSPWAFIEAEVWIRDTFIKQYRIAAYRIEQYLLYEIFKDHKLYNGFFQISKDATESVAKEFDQALHRLPLPGSLAIEYELHASGSEWDHALIQEFLDFIKAHPLCKDLYVYPRGRPSSRTLAQKSFIRVDPETHIPVFSIGTQFHGKQADWSTWNSKRILVEKDFFFKKMLLDILDTILSQGALINYSKG